MFPIDPTLPICDFVALNEAPTVWVKFTDSDTDFDTIIFDTCRNTFDTMLGVHTVNISHFQKILSQHKLI